VSFAERRTLGRIGVASLLSDWTGVRKNAIGLANPAHPLSLIMADQQRNERGRPNDDEDRFFSREGEEVT
jgi:hypothetical protein